MLLKLESLLKRVRFLDEDGTLSLTSVWQFLIIIQCALSKLDVYTFLLGMLVLLHANVKRYSRYKYRLLEAGEKDRFEKLEADLQKLNQAVQFSKLGR